MCSRDKLKAYRWWRHWPLTGRWSSCQWACLCSPPHHLWLGSPPGPDQAAAECCWPCILCCKWGRLCCSLPPSLALILPTFNRVWKPSQIQSWEVTTGKFELCLHTILIRKRSNSMEEKVDPSILSWMYWQQDLHTGHRIMVKIVTVYMQIAVLYVWWNS